MPGISQQSDFFDKVGVTATVTAVTLAFLQVVFLGNTPNPCVICALKRIPISL